MDVVGALLIGLAGGIAGGLLGIGGGTLYVPALVLLLGTPQHTAQGVSLVVIIPTAISASLANRGTGYIDAEGVRWVTPFALALAVVGAIVAGALEESLLSRVFGVMVLFVSLRTLARERAVLGRLWPRRRAERVG